MTRLARVGAAALAGSLGTLALLASPLLAGLPPIVVPYVPIDLRWVMLPVAFAGLQGFVEHVRWPGAAIGTLSAGASLAVLANLHASQVLSFLGVGWAQGGMEIDLVAMAGSLATVALGLWIAFDASHERFRQQLVDRGLDAEDLAETTRWARGRAREAVALSSIAVAGLALAIRLSGQAVGGRVVPLPGLAAIGLALAFGALLLGLPRLRGRAQ